MFVSEDNLKYSSQADLLKVSDETPFFVNRSRESLFKIWPQFARLACHIKII